MMASKWKWKPWLTFHGVHHEKSTPYNIRNLQNKHMLYLLQGLCSKITLVGPTSIYLLYNHKVVSI